MGSFKVRLAAYFALIALVPFVAAFQGFHSVAKRSETRRVDAVLESGLRSAIAAYGEELRDTRRTAAAVAHDRTLQRALARRESEADRPNHRRHAEHRRRGAARAEGRTPASARSVRGRVDRRPERDSREGGRRPPAEGRSSRAASGSAPASSRIEHVAFLAQARVAPGEATTISLGGAKYRALASEGLRDPESRATRRCSPRRARSTTPPARSASGSC